MTSTLTLNAAQLSHPGPKATNEDALGLHLPHGHGAANHTAAAAIAWLNRIICFFLFFPCHSVNAEVDVCRASERRRCETVGPDAPRTGSRPRDLSIWKRRRASIGIAESRRGMA